MCRSGDYTFNGASSIENIVKLPDASAAGLGVGGYVQDLTRPLLKAVGVRFKSCIGECLPSKRRPIVVECDGVSSFMKKVQDLTRLLLTL